MLLEQIIDRSGEMIREATAETKNSINFERKENMVDSERKKEKERKRERDRLERKKKVE